MKKLNKILVSAFICVLGSCTFMACQETQEESSGVTGGQFTENVSDVYLKKGDSEFAFEDDLPNGVTVDTSKININEVGSYPIIYEQNGATMEKVAYVFDLPTIEHIGGEIQSSYAITYEQANERNFLDPSTYGITAQDSFGNKLTVKVEMDVWYVGEYGTYEVVYTAVDMAGNETKETVSYTVSGENAPQMESVTVDVTAETVEVGIVLNEETTYVYLNDKYIDFHNYQQTSSSLIFGIDCFLEELLEGETEIELKVVSKKWYQTTTITFVDEAIPLVADFAFNQYIYLQTKSLTMPLPQKVKPQQQFDSMYALTGAEDCAFEISEDQTEIRIEGKNGKPLGCGMYTLTLSTARGGTVEKEYVATFSVYDEEHYAKLVAPLTSDQHLSSINVYDKTITSVSYDPTMNAVKVEPLQHVNDDMNSVNIEIASEEYKKIDTGCSVYKYFAVDMYFTQAPALSMLFWMSTEGGATPTQVWYGEMQIYDVEAKAIVTEKDVNGVPALKANRWYSFYMETGGLNTLHTYDSYRLFSQRLNGDINSTYYVRNIRFADQLEEKAIQDGYVYKVNDVVTFEDEFGSTYTLTDPSGNAVTANADGSFTLTASGEYTVTGNRRTYKIKSLTETEYSKVIAPLDSESKQFDGFAPGLQEVDKGKVTFTYDAEKGAYKFMQVEGTTLSHSSVNLNISLDTPAYQQFAAGCTNENYYVAFDICFEGNSATAPSNLFYTHLTNVYGCWVDEVKLVKLGDTTNTKVVWDNVRQDTWYTFYVDAAALNYSVVFMEITQTQGKINNFWMKNVRFVDASETGAW